MPDDSPAVTCRECRRDYALYDADGALVVACPICHPGARPQRVRTPASEAYRPFVETDVLHCPACGPQAVDTSAFRHRMLRCPRCRSERGVSKGCGGCGRGVGFLFASYPWPDAGRLRRCPYGCGARLRVPHARLDCPACGTTYPAYCPVKGLATACPACHRGGMYELPATPQLPVGCLPRPARGPARDYGVLALLAGMLALAFAAGAVLTLS